MRRLPIAALAALSATAQLTPDWRVLKTQHFELVSRYETARLTPLLADLEWAYATFELNSGFRLRIDRRILILIPDSPYDYQQISPSKFADGYYLGAPWRDLIVLKDLSNARQGLLHEFTHLVLHHQGGRWPAWFNEGTAEFYAEMRRTPKGVEAGSPVRNRLDVLSRGAWVPIAYFMSLSSPSELGSADAVSRFYAQSSLFVHMIRMAPEYREGFPRFRSLVADGVSTEEALKRVYAKSLNAFDSDARAWFRLRQRDVETLRPPPEPVVKVAEEKVELLDVELVRATLMAAQEKPGSGHAYGRIGAKADDGCARQAALGDLAYASRMLTQASMHYRKAVQCGVDAAVMARGLESTLEHRKHVSPEEIESIAKLTGGVRSRYLLGVSKFFSEDYSAALTALTGVSGLSQIEEFRATRLRALSLSKLKRFQEAVAEAAKLARLAQDDDQRQSAILTSQDIARYRKDDETPAVPMHEILLRNLKRIDGEVIRVDCKEQQAVFLVRSGSVTTKLTAHPGEVVTGGEGAPPLEFSCGSQKRPVTIGYKEETDRSAGSAGRIKFIQFR